MKSIKNQLKPEGFKEIELKKSAGILDDFAIRKDIQTRTITGDNFQTSEIGIYGSNTLYGNNIIVSEGYHEALIIDAFCLGSSTGYFNIGSSYTGSIEMSLYGNLSVSSNLEMSGNLTLNDGKIYSMQNGGGFYFQVISNGVSYENPDFQGLTSGADLAFNVMTRDGDGTDDALFQLWGYGSRLSQTTNQHKLIMGWISANSAYTFYVSHAGTQTEQKIIMYTNDSDTNQFVLDTDGNVGIQNANPAYELDVGGYVFASSGYYIGSSSYMTSYGIGSGIGYYGGTGYHYLTSVSANQDINLIFGGTTNSGQLTWMEDEDYFDFVDVIKLPYLGGAPGTLVNGMMWMESDGLHIYYAGAEKIVAGV